MVPFRGAISGHESARTPVGFLFGAAVYPLSSPSVLFPELAQPFIPIGHGTDYVTFQVRSRLNSVILAAMPQNSLLDNADFERARLNIPPWPTDPEKRAELLAMALECEKGWEQRKTVREFRERPK